MLLGAAAPAVPLYVAGRMLGLLPSPRQASKEQNSAFGAAATGGAAADKSGALGAALADSTTSSSSSSGDSYKDGVGSKLTSSDLSSSRMSAETQPSPDDLARDAAAVAAKGLVPYMSWYFNQASRFTWWVHDVAIEPVLGSGSRGSRV